MKTDLAAKILRKNGYKLTKQRQELLDYLSDFRQHYTSLADIDKYMRGKFSNMSHETAYRNVKEFEDIGIVEELTVDQKRFVKYQCDFDHPHHHHFICRGCGLVQEIDLEPIIKKAPELKGYKVESHDFSLFGLCPNCLAKGVE
ncbi:Fur family transcriptional regulator [Oenococcus alcoholitolerans]|uniref:Fur family transcriptional regulator n=1 Tax=Oenococcus alcoholitolerans TaxID=931074 RepID=UPI003F728CC4